VPILRVEQFAISPDSKPLFSRDPAAKCLDRNIMKGYVSLLALGA